MADDIIPKTLVLSCRSQNANLAASCFYEFEDLICDWMNADLLAPKDLRRPKHFYTISRNHNLLRGPWRRPS
jgi:hypothetical protein